MLLSDELYKALVAAGATFPRSMLTQALEATGIRLFGGGKAQVVQHLAQHSEMAQGEINRMNGG